mmetsp:Transcript_25109/g.51050  ORF Transcript_25109/g.51050 Transcript_25109/m.51050 type:complete len:514 (-) Transcript_25109:822-2363(-)
MVMEFLSPRELFNAAFSCKTLRGVVTTHMVVKSAIVHGRHAKRTMEELYALMTSHSIHVPSPLRLLRLSCGKRCEICCLGNVNFVRPRLGLFACWDCVTEWLTKAWNTKWVRYGRNENAYEAVFRNPRVAASGYGSKNYMLSQPTTDASGEPIGPIVCFDDVDKMVNHIGGFDDYFANVLGAPEPEAYNDFNNSFMEIDEMVKAASRGRERLKVERSQNRQKKKKEKIEKFLGDLSQLLDEPFRSEALTRGYSNCFDKFETGKMIVPFVNELLKPYIDAPSKMKPSILKEIAQMINEKFRLILDKNFLRLDFLSEDDAFERRLKESFNDHITSLDDLVKFGQFRHHWAGPYCGSYVDEKFISHLEKDSYIDALVHYLRDFLYVTLVPVMRECAKMLSQPSSNVLLDSSFRRDMAINIWYEGFSEIRDDLSLIRLKSFFLEKEDVVKRVWPALQEYDRWLNEKPMGEILDQGGWESQSRLHRAYQGAHRQYLLNRDFRSVFESKRMFGREWYWY